MSSQYDLIVIGTGAAATTASMQVRKAGWSVAVIDCRPYGGTCALRGCDPKKVLISAASAYDHAQRLRGHGISGDSSINWPALMAFKRSFTDPVPEKSEQRYIDKGIDTYHGTARFTGTNALEVSGQALEAKHILLAVGAEPVKLNIPGEEHLIDSEAFLSLERLPQRIVLVGGGYIAAELSHLAARTGAQVTILQHGAEILKHFDSDLVHWLMESFAAAGIDVRTGASVETIEKTGSGFIVHASTEDGTARVEADLVVHAAGRRPNFEPLDLKSGGVSAKQGRLQLNEHLQSSSNPSVYAAGDASQMGPPLTPVAGYEGRLVARNLLEGNRYSVDYHAVPSVAFTIPPIAAIGLTEARAREKGLRFRVRKENASSWFTARQAAQAVYGFKVLIEEDSDLILGAHLVGPHAEEIINLFALAMRHRLTAEDMRATLFAYPTGASDISYMV